MVLFQAKPVHAHAVLARSTPAANATVPSTPPELRLWFTEAVEPKFSSITLHDSNGAVINLPASQIDATDTKQMFVHPGALANGLYTVAWQVVSAADGHHTEGSFAFIIGAGTVTPTALGDVTEKIPWAAALIRWINLLGIALAVGALGFVGFVWQPAQEEPDALSERRLQALIWIGWLLLGVSGLLMLLMQTATVTGSSLGAALGNPALGQVVRSTRFGLLWSARMALWALMGGILWLAGQNLRLRWLALLLGTAILALHSLYSHAAAAQSAWLAILNDGLHLWLMALWSGGLLQFLVVSGALRQQRRGRAASLGRLTSYFSNYARICVVGLILTGIYSAWLQVGSWEGVQNTLYGRQLLTKLILFLPLLGIAAVNLLVTQQRLQARQEIWVGRLRGFIGAEVMLAIAILGVVGIMTSINPARNTLAQQVAAQAQAQAPIPTPIFQMQMLEDTNLHVQLTVLPGWVGENTFRIALSSLDTNIPITNATLIRLRFTQQANNIGQSELRITQPEKDLYTVKGANLSAPGDWKIRMTIQRPDQFDSVVDFDLAVTAPPPPPPPPEIDTKIPKQEQFMALLVLGLLTLTAGGYWRALFGQCRPGLKALAEF
jgi:copper transport protein